MSRDGVQTGRTGWRGLPLEAFRYDITPTGLHYLLVHFGIPLVDAAAWRLRFGGNVKKEMSRSLEDLAADRAALCL